ncbi:MAG: DUF2333 family protein [Methylococcaceae bacterium]|jgi:hypothetical protein
MATSEALDDIKSRGILWSLGVFTLVVIIVIFILGEWWSQEPEQFNVQEEALAQIKEHSTASDSNTTDLPLGYTYANTLAHIAEVLLHKPGGYLTNDVAPPGVLLDNIPNFEYGALVMLRDATSALRNHFARDQSQSEEDPDLAIAEPYFYYEHNSWALPSTEAEYEKGVEALHKYMGRLQHYGGPVKRAQFYSRADNLWQYVEVVIKRLGGLSTRLGASVSGAAEIPGVAVIAPAELTSAPESIKYGRIRQTPWLEIDDIFYEARGASWALLHILKAIKYDFHDILLDKRAMNTVDIMIKELENALAPTFSPMVLNGSGYGLFANYSLSMANYIARANAAALDLRDIMNRG